MPETTKKDEESEAKAQLERLVKDGEQIAKSFHPLLPNGVEAEHLATNHGARS